MSEYFQTLKNRDQLVDQDDESPNKNKDELKLRMIMESKDFVVETQIGK